MTVKYDEGRTLRFPEESDISFKRRPQLAARYARILTDAALANHCIQSFIADPTLPYSEEGQRQSPTVRIEYEEAIAVTGIGEGLQATNKNWGSGPQILPLKPNDSVDPMFILYIYRATSRYNRRFLQRRRLKELLGREYRSLVEKAKYRRHTKKMFVDSITEDQRHAIERRIGVDPGVFWRACRGTAKLDLPPPQVQLEFPWTAEPLSD